MSTALLTDKAYDIDRICIDLEQRLVKLLITRARTERTQFPDTERHS